MKQLKEAISKVKEMASYGFADSERPQCLNAYFGLLTIIDTQQFSWSLVRSMKWQHQLFLILVDHTNNTKHKKFILTGMEAVGHKLEMVWKIEYGLFSTKILHCLCKYGCLNRCASYSDWAFSDIRAKSLFCTNCKYINKSLVLTSLIRNYFVQYCRNE